MAKLAVKREMPVPASLPSLRCMRSKAPGRSLSASAPSNTSPVRPMTACDDCHQSVECNQKSSKRSHHKPGISHRASATFARDVYAPTGLDEKPFLDYKTRHESKSNNPLRLRHHICCRFRRRLRNHARFNRVTPIASGCVFIRDNQRLQFGCVVEIRSATQPGSQPHANRNAH